MKSYPSASDSTTVAMTADLRVSPSLTSGHPEDRVLRLREVTRIVGLSSATIYRRIRGGHFPRPLRLGGGAAVGWLWSDLQRWLQSCRMEGQP